MFIPDDMTEAELDYIAAGVEPERHGKTEPPYRSPFANYDGTDSFLDLDDYGCEDSPDWIYEGPP